ncbi:hypothetical protein, partial [Aeromonas salmonicida]|uniref:hypothetical protein n=1 Tax=Aeromonas salmonicida TaxID=645 RepID=UPI001F453E85
YIGFVIYLLGKVKGASTASFLLIFFAILSTYYACNCALFIKSALSIKGYIRSSFKSIKDNTNEKVLACAYYRDWYSTNNEGDVITSLVANIEKYFIRSFVMSLLVLGIFSIGGDASLLKSKTTHRQNEYLIFNSSGEFQKSEFILLMEKVTEGDGKVFIIRNKNERKGLKVYDFIKATLSHPERVVEIFIENKVVDSNVVIVKYEGE